VKVDTGDTLNLFHVCVSYSCVFGKLLIVQSVLAVCCVGRGSEKVVMKGMD
jgi:hypothetical protein